MKKKILIGGFIITIVMFMGVFPLRADTCSGLMKGKWFVIEGSNEGNFTHDHPVQTDRKCTQDVYCVQMAALSQSKIKLKGNFDFGVIDPEPDNSFKFTKSGGVFLPNSVEIVGKNATINNGRFVFFNGFYGGSGSAEILVKNLTLVNPSEAAFGIFGDCNSFAIDNITVQGVRAITHPEAEDWGLKDFVSVGGLYRMWWDFWDVLKIGSISITNCHIDLGSYSSVKHMGSGAFIWGIGTPENPTNILCQNNEIHNTSRHSLTAIAYAGKAKFKNNIIRAGTFADVFVGYFDGIFFGQNRSVWFHFPDDSWAPYEAGWAQMTIENNDVEVGPISTPGVDAFGILGGDMPGVVIRKNRIKVNDGLGHVLLSFGINDGAIIEKNRLSGTGSPLFAIGLTSAENTLIRNNNSKAVNPTIAHIYSGADPGGVGWAENNVFKRNKATGNIPTYYFDGIATNNTVIECHGGPDKVIDIPYDAPKAIVFADFDTWSWWIYAEYYFEDLSMWMDAYKDGNLAKPYNYLYEPYFASDWWLTQSPHEIYLPRTDPMLTLTVDGVTTTIPMPFYYDTSDGQMGLWEEWEGSLVINPVRGPLKNNIVIGCEDDDDDDDDDDDNDE